MACEICEHCQEPIMTNRSSVMRAGHSYHSECHKCYVCSETDLKGAEVFKGVIFCSRCSKRIFQGCSSARRYKESARCKPERAKSRSRPKRRDRARRHEPRRSEPPQPKNIDVLEIARFNRSFNSDSEKYQHMEAPKKISLSSMLSVYFDTGDDEVKFKHNIKRDSIEMGMMTDVTLQLLKELNCPVIECKPCKEEISHSPKREHPKLTDISKIKYDIQNKSILSYQTQKKEEQKDKVRNKPKYSDIRMAELGASTEIANMTLRKQSDFPVTTKKPQQQYRATAGSLNISSISNESFKALERWLESNETLRESSSNLLEKNKFRKWLQRPYRYFKRNILDRSSLVSVLMSSVHDQHSLFSKIKAFFQEEICVHHQNGIKKLYSAVNRTNEPYKLGWPHVPNYGSNKKTPRRRKCRHYRKSNSYRCLRDHVMRHAGPTKSELAQFRGKMVKVLALRTVKKLLTDPRKTTVSAACGDSEAASRCSPTFCIKVSSYSHLARSSNLTKGGFLHNYHY